MKYTLPDTKKNEDFTSAAVDDVELVKGGEPQELTEEQVKRLEDSTGVKLEKASEGSSSQGGGGQSSGGNA